MAAAQHSAPSPPTHGTEVDFKECGLQAGTSDRDESCWLRTNSVVVVYLYEYRGDMIISPDSK